MRRNGGTTNKDITNTGIWAILLLVLNIMTAGVGVLGVGGIVYASVLYASAGGNMEQTRRSKLIMFDVALGLIAYALMYSFMNFIIPGGVFTSATTTTTTTSSTTGGTSPGTGTGTGAGASTGTGTSGGTSTGTNSGTTSGGTVTGNTSVTGSNTMPAGALNVASYGATGNDQTDDTAAINAAINAASAKGGGTVWVPDGTYMIKSNPWAGGIIMKSNVSLIMSPGATLKQMTNSYEGSSIIDVNGLSNVTISGGTIIGDRATHTGTSGEWGMGVNIVGSNNVTVSDMTIKDCWGDGVYVGSTSSQNYSQNVVIEGILSTNNRRQGISVISAKDLVIRDSELSYTNGALPQSGIDLEPNNSNEWMQNIQIDNVYAHNNGQDWQAWYCYGVEVAFGFYENPVHPYSVSITNSRLVDNGRDYDNEQINYSTINLYKTDPRWAGKGTINISGITYN